MAFLSKRYVAKPQNRKRQRRGKQPLFDYLSTSQVVSGNKQPMQPLPDLSSTPAENLGTVDWNRRASWEMDMLSDIERLKKGARERGFDRSPFLPKTAEEYEEHKKCREEEKARKLLKARKIQFEEKGCPKVDDGGKKCMGGKTFDTNHSAVLVTKTIWCPKTWPDEQEDAIWPIETEFIIEGWDRHRNGYGRYFPVPRSEEFEWRLATPEWIADPKGAKYPVWDGKKPIPVQEKRFARIRGELDCIAGSGRWVDEEFLFDRAEETAWEEGAGIIGRKLWEKIEEDEREDMEDMEDEDGAANEEEEELFEEETAEEEEVDEGEEVDKELEEESRRLFEKLTL